MKRSPEMVRLLMQHGAMRGTAFIRTATPPPLGPSPRSAAFEEIVAIIEEEEQQARRAVSRRGPSGSDAGDEAARAAVASGDMEWLRARHAEGSLVNPIRWDGGGLLTVAVRHNRPEMLRLLLDFGFDPDERVSVGRRRLGGLLAGISAVVLRGAGQARDG